MRLPVFLKEINRLMRVPAPQARREIMCDVWCLLTRIPLGQLMKSGAISDTGEDPIFHNPVLAAAVPADLPLYCPPIAYRFNFLIYWAMAYVLTESYIDVSADRLCAVLREAGFYANEEHAENALSLLAIDLSDARRDRDKATVLLKAGTPADALDHKPAPKEPNLQDEHTLAQWREEARQWKDKATQWRDSCLERDGQIRSLEGALEKAKEENLRRVHEAKEAEHSRDLTRSEATTRITDLSNKLGQLECELERERDAHQHTKWERDVHARVHKMGTSESADRLVDFKAGPVTTKKIEREFFLPSSYNTLQFQNMVRKFHEKMGLPIHIEHWSAEQFLFRSALITEEAAEFVAAASAGNYNDMIDALCDLLYVVFGTGVVMGVDLAPSFLLVHEKNMLKTPSGSPTKKPSKPEGWTAPVHDDQACAQTTKGGSQ